MEKPIIDKSFKNKKTITELIQKYKIKKTVVLIYYLKANNIIKKNINLW